MGKEKGSELQNSVEMVQKRIHQRLSDAYGNDNSGREREKKERKQMHNLHKGYRKGIEKAKKLKEELSDALQSN